MNQSAVQNRRARELDLGFFLITTITGCTVGPMVPSACNCEMTSMTLAVSAPLPWCSSLIRFLLALPRSTMIGGPTGEAAAFCEVVPPSEEWRVSLCSGIEPPGCLTMVRPQPGKHQPERRHRGIGGIGEESS